MVIFIPKFKQCIGVTTAYDGNLLQMSSDFLCIHGCCGRVDLMQPKQDFPTSPPLCACGCGFPTNRVQRKLRYYRFCKNHHLKLRNNTPELHPRWKGGIIRSGGYVFIRVYEPHPRALPRGNGMYVKRAVLTIEITLGRLLEQGEEVHHINGVKDDDRPENLQVMLKSVHMRHHANFRYRQPQQPHSTDPLPRRDQEAGPTQLAPLPPLKKTS